MKCGISSGSALFAETKTVFRERNSVLEIITLNSPPPPPKYMQWTILTLLYQTLFLLAATFVVC